MSGKIPLEKFLVGSCQASNSNTKALDLSENRNNLHHIFEQQDLYALWAAFSAKRPLLIRGEPGTGKSQAAKAIAQRLGWGFVKETINGTTELSDLHWHFDAIGRLAEAQVMGSGGSSKEKGDDPLNPLNFLAPGAFWWAYNWKTASGQFARCKTQIRSKPENFGDGEEPKGVVLLLDEIDKAQPDLANGLLETLGDRSFNVPFLSSNNNNSDINPVKAAEDANVLVVITTNEERELPSAFLRRCFVHTLNMGPVFDESENYTESDKTSAKCNWLIERGKLHFGSSIKDDVYKKAAELVWADREAQTLYKPGLAEYIDLLKALSEVKSESDEEAKEQLAMLEAISSYALKKEMS
ncbi:AAA family ATPase [Sessilibacter corallicola]|uniref:MoxR family ATPase n=1 Tax=Sessilibacter corallicola TaxID=2904075 RepID=A0ABQ0AD84_9GAMM